MNELQQRIVCEGRVLPGDIIKVDGFMNHRVDTALMRSIARDIHEHFAGREITKVMTVEASGIPLATITADELGVPLLFAKKAKSDNIEGGLVKSEIFSYTYKKKVTLIVSAEWISPEDKILIVDDFMANGEAIRGLVEIIDQVGAELVGVGIAIEKGFQGGGDRLRARGVDVYSLAIIEHAEPGNIVFRE
ncbi:MAG: xanthine phosphoribosyltransferase [Clostridia bacterium]|nr:xanthine phosphoribosyltransferase [Clostridia bacterium]